MATQVRRPECSARVNEVLKQALLTLERAGVLTVSRVELEHELHLLWLERAGVLTVSRVELEHAAFRMTSWLNGTTAQYQLDWNACQ